MCWTGLLIGGAMTFAGVALLVRFFTARGATAVERAGTARTESMILGALLASVGPLLFLLGLTGLLCDALGIGW